MNKVRISKKRRKYEKVPSRSYRADKYKNRIEGLDSRLNEEGSVSSKTGQWNSSK